MWTGCARRSTGSRPRIGLCKALVAAQIVTFIAWWILPMGPVSGALGIAAVADWLATTVLM
ncbi:hypothetical protein AMK09_33520 [Streptomyces sp. CB02488]|nr:hypothetical protein AMK09_33520 [Streptomyces sp. CB02488]